MFGQFFLLLLLGYLVGDCPESVYDVELPLQLFGHFLVIYLFDLLMFLHFLDPGSFLFPGEVFLCVPIEGHLVIQLVEGCDRA